MYRDDKDARAAYTHSLEQEIKHLRETPPPPIARFGLLCQKASHYAVVLVTLGISVGFIGGYVMQAFNHHDDIASYTHALKIARERADIAESLVDISAKVLNDVVLDQTPQLVLPYMQNEQIDLGSAASPWRWRHAYLTRGTPVTFVDDPTDPRLPLAHWTVYIPAGNEVVWVDSDGRYGKNSVDKNYPTEVRYFTP